MRRFFALLRENGYMRVAVHVAVAVLLLASMVSGVMSFSVQADGGSLEWSFVDIPDLPEGAIFPRDSLWSDQPENLYVWANLNPDLGEREAFLFHWDGSTWTAELHLVGYSGNQIYGTSPDNVFAAAHESDAEPLVYRFDGSSWIEQQLPAEVTYIKDIHGVAGEIQAGAHTANNSAWLRYEGNNTWSILSYRQMGNTHNIAPENIFFISPTEGYAASCWGHAWWDGSTWNVKEQFDFCDINEMWGTKDDSGQLHLYVAGNNNFSNGIRVWKYDEDASSFGSKCGFVFGDPTNGSFICSGVQAIGGAYGLWGSSWDDVYAVGRLGEGTAPDSGRIYHYDGMSWQRITEFGDLPTVQDVWGSGPNDVWFALRDGRLLHIGPLNAPPILTVNHSALVFDEGQTAVNSGTVEDDDGDLIVLSASQGAVANNGDGTWSWNQAAEEGPAESTITITADDGQDTAQVDFALTVENFAPAVGEFSVPLDPVQVGTAIEASAGFTDPGVLDTHTADWDWGDGNTSAGTVSETDGSGTVIGSHSYTEAGVYAVSLTMTDDDGASASAEYQYAVVYDPEGGFVTGGGWIWSEEGFCQLDATCAAAEGKASIGFVSKYKKGASAPIGNTQFQFKAGDLTFHSSSYDWLVIAGSKAMYKGLGTVNGQGNYGFLISAVDQDLTPSTDVDLFRIKIWDRDDDDFVVYDNMMGQDEDADPTTAIGGGNIVIHK